MNWSLICDCQKTVLKIGPVKLSRTNRCLCGCQGCRAYTKFLGRSQEILDPNGGTDIIQISPSKIQIEKGRENIVCVKQTPKGCLRWYTRCCKTPIGNTLDSSSIPFIGVIRKSLGQEGEGPSEASWGPIRGKINFSDKTLDSPPRELIPMLARLAWIMIGWRLSGAHKNHPLFDRKSGKPISTPECLNKEQYKKLIAKTI